MVPMTEFEDSAPRESLANAGKVVTKPRIAIPAWFKWASVIAIIALLCEIVWAVHFWFGGGS
jgi:hypothetical protein